MGRSGKLAREGKLDLKAVVDHFCSVNGISWAEFKTINTAAFNQWRERNKYDWSQDFGEYSSLVHR